MKTIEQKRDQQSQRLTEMLDFALTAREKLILREIIAGYISTAQPIGSRTLSKRLQGRFSPATIRNVMADLEENGLLDQPHTSAGRVPTELGYRIFVNDLMEHDYPSGRERKLLDKQISQIETGDILDMLEQTANLLSEISNLLCVVASPQAKEGILHRIDLITTGGDKILVVITIKSGFVRSLFLEVQSGISHEEIEWVTDFLNQRLSGLNLMEIRNTIAERLRGSGAEHVPVVKTVLDHAGQVFTFNDRDGYILGGMKYLAAQPEFYNVEELRKILTLFEDRQLFVQIFARGKEGLKVSIGRENALNALSSFSIVTAPYRFRHLTGSIGLIGPMRMNYSKAVSIIEYTAKKIDLIKSDEDGDEG
ncbi:MAG: heat-inducible transcriptional repressor HrcA [bacterium]